MSFEKGQRVIYDGRELCRIDELCTKCFDGVHSERYFRIIPESTPASCYYVPADRIEDRVRPLMTREEIYAAIDGSMGERMLTDSDKNRRREILSRTVKSGDSSLIIGMVRELLEEKSRRNAEGKELIACDEKALAAACRQIGAEFSAVLGIPESEVGRLIEERLSANR
ncbi:MAG: hypothetical protein ACI4J0_10845 [Huintestinicola sp.]|uniref:hypothetical protein n=1 Tax=Huintestinicola sp. TaxID=2981661 RepID=UPI003F02EC08